MDDCIIKCYIYVRNKNVGETIKDEKYETELNRILDEICIFTNDSYETNKLYLDEVINLEMYYNEFMIFLKKFVDLTLQSEILMEKNISLHYDFVMHSQRRLFTNGYIGINKGKVEYGNSTEEEATEKNLDAFCFYSLY